MYYVGCVVDGFMLCDDDDDQMAKIWCQLPFNNSNNINNNLYEVKYDARLLRRELKGRYSVPAAAGLREKAFAMDSPNPPKSSSLKHSDLRHPHPLAIRFEILPLIISFKVNRFQTGHLVIDLPLITCLDTCLKSPVLL